MMFLRRLIEWPVLFLAFLASLLAGGCSWVARGIWRWRDGI